MSTTIAWPDCASISTFSGNGSGPDFLKLKKYWMDILEEIRKAESLGRIDNVLQSLESTFEECSHEGWDGYDAKPIDETSYMDARRFIEKLPLTSTVPMPEIVPEPSGEIGLEWSKGKARTFVVSFSGNSEIIYAGLSGTNKTHGTVYFSDSLPQVIIENLERLYS